MKYASTDIETLGLKFTSGLIEFGAVLDDLDNIKPLEELPRFHAYIIQDQYLGEPYAMSMHATILRRIADRAEGFTYLYPSQLGQEFKKFLLNHGYEEDKNPGPDGFKKVTITIGGKNFMGFDYRFLEEHTDFTKHIRVRSRVIDPGSMYYQPGDKVLPSLGECLKRAGVSTEVAHTSIEDALDTIKVIRHKYVPVSH